MDERYSRQILFPGIGEEGQANLLKSRVLLVGCGALGAAHAESLARAGVGFLRIIDRDFVEFSNLQRQALFTEEDAEDRIPKAIAAKNRLSAVNSTIEIDARVNDVNNSNIEELVADVDLVIDGTDNFQVRYLINDACVKLNKPWIYGAAVSSYGTSMTIIPGETPCLRCIFEEVPAAGTSPTCETAGVIQPIINSISAIQVTEAIKLLTLKRDELHGSLLQIDIWRSDWRSIKLSKPNIGCATCDKKHFEFLKAEAVDLVSSLCGRNSIQIQPQESSPLDLNALEKRLAPLGKTTVNEFLLRLAVDDFELTVFRDARAIIQGTDDPVVAKSLYSKYIGN
ncbi:MAG: thiazole biosynthesis adenylyltransferase ThiF [Pyrinomonadaceae bacterium]|nr:thiazole biosynthesis adenylyltransferase ThiF [Pyrinomonadaceae bacterium]